MRGWSSQQQQWTMDKAQKHLLLVCEEGGGNGSRMMAYKDVQRSCQDSTVSSYTHVMGSLSWNINIIFQTLTMSFFHTAVRFKVWKWSCTYVFVLQWTVRMHLAIHTEGQQPSGSEGPAFRRLAPSQGLQQLGCWTWEEPGGCTRPACVPPMKSLHIWQHLLTTSTQPVLSAVCDETHINTKIMALWHRAPLCAASGNECIKCALTPRCAHVHVFTGYLHFIVKTRFWGRASLFLLRDPVRSYEIWKEIEKHIHPYGTSDFRQIAQKKTRHVRLLSAGCF